MRVRYCTLISAGLLLLALPGLAFANLNSAPAKRHYHASIKHVSSRHALYRHSLGRHGHARESHYAVHHEYASVEMPPERATQIQTALIKQGYMTGEPTGTWDAQTIAAMQKLQADNGWQTKITPDARALIKLGLGPKAPGPDVDSGIDTGSGTDTAQTQTIAQTPPQ